MKISDLPAEVKSILADGGLASMISSESYNIRSACVALENLSELTAHEAWEDGEDPRDVRQIASIMQQLARYVADEAGEILQAISSKTTAETEIPDPLAPVDPFAPAMLSARVLSLGYVKSLHLSLDEERMKDLVAAKSIGGDRIRAYSHLWGDPQLVDVEAEFFTPQSDFWDESLKSLRRPLTYDHAQEAQTKSSPIVGFIDSFGDDEIGRWYEAELDKSHRYRKAIDALISKRALGSSSDSAPQYVVRKSAKNGSVWLAVWPWFACALTPTPAEPRMMTDGSPVFKSVLDQCAKAIDSRMGKSVELSSRPDSLIAALELLNL